MVIGNELLQYGIGRVEIGGLRQAEFAGEAILEQAPETFDAALGLGSLGGDEGDAELFESTAKLRGLALAGELFVDGPVIVVAGEDAAAIAVRRWGGRSGARGFVAGGNSPGRFPTGKTER